MQAQDAFRPPASASSQESDPDDFRGPPQPHARSPGAGPTTDNHRHVADFVAPTQQRVSQPHQNANPVNALKGFTRLRSGRQGRKTGPGGGGRATVFFVSFVCLVFKNCASDLSKGKPRDVRACPEISWAKCRRGFVAQRASNQSPVGTKYSSLGKGRRPPPQVRRPRTIPSLFFHPVWRAPLLRAKPDEKKERPASKDFVYAVLSATSEINIQPGLEPSTLNAGPLGLRAYLDSTTVAPTGSRLYRRLATGGASVGG
jgi:hypothetical protein